METDAFLRTSHRLLKVASVVVLPDASLDSTAVGEVHQELVNHALTALSVNKRVRKVACHAQIPTRSPTQRRLAA